MKNDKPHIGGIEELDPEDIFNKNIITGYRINYSTWRAILLSIFEWHNETINIWTHLVGFIIYMVVLLVIGFSQIGEDISPSDTAKNVRLFLSHPNGSWDFGFVES